MFFDTFCDANTHTQESDFEYYLHDFCGCQSKSITELLTSTVLTQAQSIGGTGESVYTECLLLHTQFVYMFHSSLTFIVTRSLSTFHGDSYRNYSNPKQKNVMRIQDLPLLLDLLFAITVMR